MRLHIGVDDTDSPGGGCTTYIGALLVERLTRLGLRFLDYPNLIRLNPNVPWKTRGNGAICLRVEGSEEQVARSIEEAVSVVEDNADLAHEKTHPGLVFLRGEVPGPIRLFSETVIRDIAQKADALKLIRRFGADAVGFKKGRGLIGALAAIGERLDKGDYTYELLVYRAPENWGQVRRVAVGSVIEMDRLTRPLTFNNFDYETRRVLITPRGPDPILYGVRGESPEAVWKAYGIVRVDEAIDRWVIYRTNQGTDAHFPKPSKVGRARPYRPVTVRGTVVSTPRAIRGGHVIFRLGDETGEIDCAAYEPTGRFRHVVRMLRRGDLIEAFGGVRPPTPDHPATINLEKIRIVRLARKAVHRNPLCPRCGKRMKSAGKDKGLECKGCGLRSLAIRRILETERRELAPGLYIPPPRAQRHLTKPLSRYGMEKDAPPVSPRGRWHAP
ncbi:TPA: DUF1743 domain-containing protein [Candidatus Bathyarchaeota archaeon]|nr:DUF1743 domain-containing protein [Candidatus Bathyarchaeota archaeon]